MVTGVFLLPCSLCIYSPSPKKKAEPLRDTGIDGRL
jgi:hypothetical protein